MRRAIVLLCLLLVGLPWSGLADRVQPNIVVILADDLGYSDVGCYGSEIETPNLDRLAAGGLRFSQFYNTAKCHSSRVSLLTGRWCHQAGDTSLCRAVTLPEVLGQAGYFSVMAGKWHLDRQPTDFGFQRYFGHLSGACNYYRGDATFRLNGQPWEVPGSGFYTTVANVDFALKFLAEARATRKPWFLYLAFNAPHAPLQPLESDYKKYLGRYACGWDAVRAARVDKQRALGLFGRTVEPSPRPDHVPAWDTLPEEARDWEARRMAAYAALIDRVDQEIGRLLADLARSGEMDNTLILFFSDNGACPYDRRSTGSDRAPYHPDTTWSDSTGWAWARNTPFRYYKQNQFEGGIATPAIAHWPAGLKAAPGSLSHAPAHLVDVLPTLSELARAAVPTNWPGREPSPLAGVSLVPVLCGRELPSRPPIHLLFSGDRGLRDGDWKLVSFQSDPWELYNIAEDRTELKDVAAQHPELVARLSAKWVETAEKVLRAPAKECKPVAAQAAEPRRHREWTDYSDVDTRTERHGTAKVRKRATKTERVDLGVRARIGTRLEVKDSQLHLVCEGQDPGLAFDALSVMPDAGPYELAFRVMSTASGDGEIYWTTDAKTQLPKGSRVTFPVKHDGEWQAISVKIPETKRLFGLRLDPCSGAGEVTIEGLSLLDATGKRVATWP